MIGRPIRCAVVASVVGFSQLSYANELMAGLSVLAYGYEVKASMNGSDLGIEGGKSENRRLFNQGHPMSAKATPAVRAKNFVLRPGANELRIDYVKLDAKSSEELEVILQAQGYSQPILRIVNKTKAADKLVIKFDLAAKQPAGFKPIEIFTTK